MFGFRKTKDIITLFHKANSPTSVKVASLLKQASAKATENSVEDSSSGKSSQRAEFELDITENPPTSDQLQTILQYVSKDDIHTIVTGANTEGDALKLFKRSADNFQRPVTVDWSNGKAVAGDNESKILKMLSELSK